MSPHCHRCSLQKVHRHQILFLIPIPFFYVSNQEIHWLKITECIKVSDNNILLSAFLFIRSSEVSTSSSKAGESSTIAVKLTIDK